jgi:hypothetical protein
MNRFALTPLVLVAALLGCGKQQSHVDRALLFDFPDDPKAALKAAATIRAQAEKDGGQCAAVAAKLHQAAVDFELDDRGSDLAVDLDPLSSDVQDSIDARSDSYSAMLDAVKSTERACPREY